MPPTARPLVSCWKNCSMGALVRRREGGPRDPPRLRGACPRVLREWLLLQHEVAGLVDLVDPVQLADPVALLFEGDLAGEAREVLQGGGQVLPEPVGLGALALLDGLHDHAEAVTGQHAVDRGRGLAEL